MYTAVTPCGTVGGSVIRTARVPEPPPLDELSELEELEELEELPLCGELTTLF